ncbi:MAG: immune inhibitor A, partial [Bacteroidales bacterium]|nr:immune inhibitor A [Bacteroidales bacterium]
VIMIFAGHSRAAGDNNGIWPCSSDAKIMSKGSTLDVIGYCCGPELEGSSGTTMAGIGHICHEFGHRMGLPDFYDTNKSEHGSNVAVSCEEYSLMDHGSYNNNGKTPPPLSILEKSICGWASINDIPEISSSGSIELHEIGQDPSRTRALAIPTDQAGEIFICEYRTTASSVNKWNAGLSRGGLLVYHVDLSDREITQDGESYPAADWWDKGTINNNGGHPLFYLIPSGAQNSLRNTDMAKVPFPGSQNIIKYRPVSWNNTVAYVSLSGISYNSSMASNPTLTFNANVRQFPLINNPKDGIYSSGSELTLKLSPGSNDSETVSQWFFDGQEVVSSEPRPKVALTAGGHVVEALLSSGKKLRLDITAK